MSSFCQRTFLAGALLFHSGVFGQSSRGQDFLTQPEFSVKTPGDPYNLGKATLTRPKIGLVLSGGGARGIAHIGVLKALEKHQVPIDFIVGSSMGAIVGGLYAAGYSVAELESIALTTNWTDVLSLTEDTRRSELYLDQKQAQEHSFLLFRLDGLEPVIPASLSSGQRLTNFLTNLTFQALYHPNPSFDDLKIPFRAVATDLVSGKREVMGSGSLAEALRATVTVPLLFAPLKRDSMSLVDGGLVSNAPVDIAKESGCELIISSNTTSMMRSPGQLNAPWETADQIMSIMMQSSNEKQFSMADVVLTPDLGNHLSSEFTRLDSLIRIGEQETDRHIDTMRALLSSRQTVTSGRAAQNTDHAAQNRPVLLEVRFTGNTAIPSEMILAEFQSVLGAPMNFLEIRTCVENVIRLYREQHYSLARIDALDFDPTSGILQFTVNEGLIRRVEVKGNTYTEDYVIRREFPQEDGELFNIRKAQNGIVNINSTGLFEYVLLDAQFEENLLVIVVKVEEKRTNSLRVGIHADNERSFQGLVDLRDANLFGSGAELGLTVAANSRNRLARLEYHANRIFNTIITFSLGGYYQFDDILAYDNGPSTTDTRWERVEIGRYRQIKYGGRLSFGTQLERLGNITAEFRMENQEIKPLSSSGYTPDRYNLASFKLGTVVDTENRFPFPTSGMMLAVNFESAMQQLGSDVSFGKLFITYENYTTVFGNHTFRPKITIGLADATLPLAEQFSLGGLNSFLGLREDDGRGRQLFLVNTEYRFHIPFKIIFDTFLKVRYDLGMISGLPEEIQLVKLHHGIGAELALDTPIGPTSFGIGKSFFLRRDLRDKPVSSGPVLLYFSVGYGM